MSPLRKIGSVLWGEAALWRAVSYFSLGPWIWNRDWIWFLTPWIVSIIVKTSDPTIFCKDLQFLTGSNHLILQLFTILVVYKSRVDQQTWLQTWPALWQWLGQESWTVKDVMGVFWTAAKNQKVWYFLIRLIRNFHLYQFQKVWFLWNIFCKCIQKKQFSFLKT